MPVSKGYRRKRLVKNWRRYCTKGSIRTLKRGKTRILICRPKGSKKTRAISIDRPTVRFGELPGETRRRDEWENAVKNKTFKDEKAEIRFWKKLREKHDRDRFLEEQEDRDRRR